MTGGWQDGSIMYILDSLSEARRKISISLGPLTTRKDSHTGVSRFPKPLRQIGPISEG